VKLPARDLALKLKAFFSQVFDWSLKIMALSTLHFENAGLDGPFFSSLDFHLFATTKLC